MILLIVAAAAHGELGCDPFLKWSADPAIAQDAPVLVVTDFQVEYVHPLSFLPRITSVARTLADLDLQLSVVDGVYHAPRTGVPPIRLKVGDLVARAPVSLDVSAVRLVCDRLAAHYRGGQPAIDHFVAASPADMDPAMGADRRPSGRTELLLMLAFDGPPIPVSTFELRYAGGGHPDLPPLEAVADAVEVECVTDGDRLVTWRPDGAARRMRLSALDGTAARSMSAGAVQLVLEGISRHFADAGLIAVYVRPADGELGAGAADRRAGRESFRVDIIAATVATQRTLASGDRIDPDQRVDHPAHARILGRSPFTPADPEDPDAADMRNKLLYKKQLDDYLYRLSRHPGRRVVSAVTPGPEPGTIGLDYVVTENKPLTLYAEVSNTGTGQTDTVRERFGLFHNQLTGHDDILSVEYITAGFDETNAVIGYYDAPVGDSETFRWRLSGLWSAYDASDVGFANQQFSGDTWSVGGELAWTLHQDGPLFLDLVGGVRYLDVSVDNRFLQTSGRGGFVLPYAGMRLERSTDEARTDVFVGLESNFDNLTDVDRADLNRMGRFAPDEDWRVVRWDASQSLFLEPLLDRAAWEDISTAESSTLAHELLLRFRGQYAFDQRLIPQLEQVAGGLYTVRGYPEAVIAADTVLLGTLEYRLHVPWAYPYRQELSRDVFGRPFRAVPQQPYGRADWDLVLKAFLDVAYARVSDRFFFESDETLVGAGVGVEFSFRQNLKLRLDWGFALEEIPGRVNSGSNRLHVVAQLFF